MNTWNPEKFYVQPASTTRLAQLGIPYMQHLFIKIKKMLTTIDTGLINVAVN